MNGVGYVKEERKRLLLNDQDVAAQISRIELTIQSLTQQVLQLTNNLNAVKTDAAMQIESQQAILIKQSTEIAKLEAKTANTGSTYIRWGRTSCSGSDAQLVYSGYAAGNHYTGSGGPANLLCLPNDPELSNITLSAFSYLYGTEIEENILRPDSHNEDVPCAVCKTTSTQISIMIPGRETCYTGWKMEYYGLLTSDRYTYSASTYVCVDRYPEYIPGGQDNKDGRLLHITTFKCGSLLCPPYKEDHAVNCVVCSQ